MNSYLKDFLGGIANIVYTPKLKIEKRSINNRTDYEALYSDWEKVGLDMRKAIEKYKNDYFKENGDS